MLRLVSDEDIPRSLIRGLRLRQPAIDIVRAQEVGLRTKDDPIILEWSAEQARVVITRDRQTMTGFAYERVAAGRPMPGVIILHEDMGIGQAIEQILMVAVCCAEEEMRDRVVFLPL